MPLDHLILDLTSANVWGSLLSNELSAVRWSTLSVHYLFHHGSAIVLKTTCVEFVIPLLLTSWFVQVGDCFSLSLSSCSGYGVWCNSFLYVIVPLDLGCDHRGVNL